MHKNESVNKHAMDSNPAEDRCLLDDAELAATTRMNNIHDQTHEVDRILALAVN